MEGSCGSEVVHWIPCMTTVYDVLAGFPHQKESFEMRLCSCGEFGIGSECMSVVSSRGGEAECVFHRFREGEYRVHRSLRTKIMLIMKKINRNLNAECQIYNLCASSCDRSPFQAEIAKR